MTKGKLSLIVTGPILSFSDNQIRLFENVISQGGSVVISTWDSSKQSLPNHLLNNIKILTSSDWVSPLGYSINGKDKQINFDKQVHLIKTALLEIKSEYTLRLRSDISIDIDAIWQHKFIMDSGLIVTTDVSSVNYKLLGSSGLLLHPCDWLFAGQTRVLNHFISECDYYVELIKNNNRLNVPYKIEDRAYTSTGSAEQSFGASLASFKLADSFFNSPSDIYRLYSPISNGFYVVESSSLKLMSLKQKLRFKYPFRIKEVDNYEYRKIRLGGAFLLELIAHKIRCLLKTN